MVWKLFTQVLLFTSSNRRTCKQSARWSNLDLAKCMFCSLRIWLFALSIIIDNYNQCYCCRNGQSRIRILLSETNLISIPHSILQPWILDPTLFLAHFTRLTPHLTCHTITVDKLTMFFFERGSVHERCLFNALTLETSHMRREVFGAQKKTSQSFGVWVNYIVIIQMFCNNFTMKSYPKKLSSINIDVSTYISLSHTISCLYICIKYKYSNESKFNTHFTKPFLWH